MRLHLLRHAIAAPRDARRWPDDRLRPLTRAGASRMTRAARGMRRLEMRFDRILTSPLARAVETARIVAAACPPRDGLGILGALAPAGGPGAVLAALADLPPRSTILLVGHEPDLSLLAAALVLEPGIGLPIEFKKGGLCRIDTEGAARPGTGRLIAILTPRVLRRLGSGRRD